MKIVFVFSGYGAQFVGMGKELYDESRVVQEYFEEAAKCVDRNFVKLCFASSDVELNRLENIYFALFLVSSAIAAAVKQEGIIPDAVVGYNSGLYSAMHTAGIMTFPDGLYLLSKYVQIYQEEFVDVVLKAVRISGIMHKQLADICAGASTNEQQVHIAAQEAEYEFIIAGHESVIKDVVQRMRDAQEVTIAKVPVEFGLHSVLLNDLLARYQRYMEKVDFKDTDIEVGANRTPHMMVSGNIVKQELCAQIVSMISRKNLLDSVRSYDVIVQIGPTDQFHETIAQQYPEKKVIVINTIEDIEALKKIVIPENKENEDSDNDSL